LKHFVENEEECEDKSRYSAFLEYFEEHYTTEEGKKTFESIDGIQFILKGLEDERTDIRSCCFLILGKKISSKC
jgi:hypothetical protein